VTEQKIKQALCLSQKQQNLDFYQKYKLFQLHKWEILKTFKQKLFENAIKRRTGHRGLKKMLQWAIVHREIKKLWNRFDRDRMIKRVMKKFVMKFWLYALRFRRKIKRYGPTFEQRNHRMVQCHLNSTCLIVDLSKERAKNMMKDFLSVRVGFIEFADRINELPQKVILIQRFVRVRLLILKNSRWFGTFKQEVLLAKSALTILMETVHGLRIFKNYLIKRELQKIKTIKIRQ
jgi:hypothetical protein